MLSLTFKCFSWNWIPFWLLHPSSTLSLNTICLHLKGSHSKGLHLKGALLLRPPNSTQWRPTIFFLFVRFLLDFEKKTIIKEFTHICVYTLTSICLAQWNICSQCKNVLEQIAQDLSLVLRAPKHKRYTFHADFWWCCWFQILDSTFFRVASGSPKWPQWCSWAQNISLVLRKSTQTQKLV